MPNENVKRLEWLRDELDTVITNLHQVPCKWPTPGNIAETEIYAAGLRDMADWLLETIEHEIGWHGLVKYFPQLRQDSSKLKLVKKPPKASQ